MAVIQKTLRLMGSKGSQEVVTLFDSGEPVSIGAATLQKWRMKLDFEADEVIIDPRVTKLRLL